MEIITYVLDGELEHKDSMGTGSIIRPGDAQRMSAGRGVRHSEFNHSATTTVHFLQIWVIPDVRGIAPEYEQRTYPAAERRGQLRQFASPDGAGGSLLIHQDARLYAGDFDGAETARLPLSAGRLGYVQVARGQVSVNGQLLNAQHFRQQLPRTPVRGWFGWSTANHWPHLPLTQIAGVALLTLCCLALSFALAGWGPFNQRLLAATATPTQAAQATTLPGTATVAAKATATATVTQVAFHFSPVESLAVALPPLELTVTSTAPAA